MFERLADEKKSATLQEISDAIRRAEDLPEKEQEKAAEIYESIVKLYSNVRWAEDLVKQAQSKLEALSKN